MLRYTTLSVFVLSLSTTALSALVSKDLHIVNKLLAPDGFPRKTVLAGDTFPGPIITGNKGDNFQINVFDDLTDSSLDVVTSIHWHGIFQQTTNYADGVAFVTQCPIIPGNSFLYNFSVPDQAGTYWYHSHYSAQYCDGLRGALIVYDPDDPHAGLYDVDDESTVITVADWYLYLSPDAPPVANVASVLINGAGRYSGATTNPALAVVNVQAGKRYRFRLISIACDPNFLFSIDGHRLTVIEADGGNVQPVVVDSIQIFAAQRYSVVLNANQPVGNYWIRALPNTPGASFTGGLNSAILRYSGAATADPTSTQKTNPSLLLETDLHPFVASPVPGTHAPGAADFNINLDIALVGGQFRVNNVSFESPSVPVLLQILSGASQASDLLPTGSIYGLSPNKVIELTIPGGSPGGPHPFHLHGHSFYVVRSAGNSSYNWDNPVIRDVVSIGAAGDKTTIRFVTDNPGPWFLHCHIDWHLTQGLAVVFAEDVPDTSAIDVAPDAWKALCPAYNTFIGDD